MEKSKGRRRNMVKSHLCIPRLVRGSASCRSSGGGGSGTVAATNSRLSPAMSLLERFREAVFRLIMLTALSKATTGHGGSRRDVPRSYYPNDPHHSEAVADCIEFIKKSASPEDSRGSTASSSMDAARPVSVM